MTSTRTRRIRAWVRVVAGLAVAIFGILGIDVYPPPEDSVYVLCGFMILIGAVMVVSGWLALRTYKYEESGVCAEPLSIVFQQSRSR